MNVKKIMSFMAIALTIVVANVTFGQAVYASEIANTNIVANKSEIQSDTIITKDNIYDVLDYAGLDSSSFKQNDVNGSTTLKTAGELKDAIEQAKNETATVTNKTTKDNSIISSNKITLKSTRSGSKKISTETSISDAYTLTYSVSGQYTGSEWTGVSNPDVDVDTDIDGVISYKIAPDAYLDASFDADTITLESYVTVNKYVAITYGTVCVGYQGISATNYFYASDYL